MLSFSLALTFSYRAMSSGLAMLADINISLLLDEAAM